MMKQNFTQVKLHKIFDDVVTFYNKMIENEMDYK